VGDRRHGKTSLSRVVQRDARRLGAVVIAASAERETYAEFVAALAAELAGAEPAWAQELSRLRVSLTAGPIRVERDGRAAAALDQLLERTVDRAGNRQVVLFIDEVTVLARNLERQERGSGDSFLHTLRRFRQEYGGRVATVLSGSTTSRPMRRAPSTTSARSPSAPSAPTTRPTLPNVCSSVVGWTPRPLTSWRPRWQSQRRTCPTTSSIWWRPR
jgi:hypothetical protein